MHDVEFVGGSLDGSQVRVQELRSTLRLPPAAGTRWSEVYEHQQDGRYHFVRHGMPPLMQLPEREEAEANKELASMLQSLMPLLLPNSRPVEHSPRILIGILVKVN